MVFVAGGSGFVGSLVVGRLLDSGFTVRALARSPDRFPIREHPNLQLAEGDVLSPNSLSGAMDGCTAVVNTVGIIRERRSRGVTFDRLHIDSVRNLLDQADRFGIGRFIHMSALGVREDGVTRYQVTKYVGEEAVKKHAASWTIFRPSIIVGPGTGFVSVLTPLVKLPLTPVFGDGNYLFEPVDKRVVADAFVKALSDDSTVGKVIELRGPKAYSYNEILDAVGKALGRRRVRKLHLPLWLARPVVSATGWLPFSPVTRGQLEMLVSSEVSTGVNGVEEMGLREIDLPQQLEHALEER